MLGINNCMNKFEKRFFTLLDEANLDDLERDAFVDTLDDETSLEDFDIDTDISETGGDNAAVEAARAHAEHAAEMKTQLEGWVSEMDNFLKRLNGEQNSIQATLAAAEPDTIFDRMKVSEQRKITRVATELAGLTESFRGYISQTDNPAFRHV